MAKEKSKVKSSNLKVANINLINTLLEKFSPDKISSYRPSKNVIFILAVAAVLALAVYKKDWFIAAMVNGQPVSNLELQARLNGQFKTQTLNQMINEKIILDEANKNNAIPTDSEIEKRIAEIETSVGGVEAFNNLVTQQGQNRESVKQQLKIQLSIEKLFAKDATVSADEVNKFIETNKDALRATDSASQTIEAENTLKQQKISQIFQQKFQELRTKAKIQIF